jgi:hypothetical protein
MTRRLAAAAGVLLLATACTHHVSGRPTAAGSSPSPPGPSKRPVTRPHGAIVVVRAARRAERRLRRAEHDLKEVGLWHRLADHLYEVRVSVRPGRSDIPSDRHLADAYPSAVAKPGGFGSLCDIAFYPAAIAADLARWRRYYSQGRAGRPPATLRQYWGSILAHELGHCLGNGKGERVADHWERIARDRLRHQQANT